ncbi:MAG: cbb3-type cytochrome oxidase assembly protein CcoS [Gallionellaceae bacterium]|jgi:cbb3-type cytochrome oxidase maturation protein
MDVIYSLIPGMTVFGLVFVGILIWAVKHGQYEDMEGNASRILLDDDEDAMLRDDVAKPDVKKEDEPPAQP